LAHRTGRYPRPFLQPLFAARISTFFALHVLVSAVALPRFMGIEIVASGFHALGWPHLPLCLRESPGDFRYFFLFANFNGNESR
jgi:hypothetical protein